MKPGRVLVRACQQVAGAAVLSCAFSQRCRAFSRSIEDRTRPSDRLLPSRLQSAGQKAECTASDAQAAVTGTGRRVQRVQHCRLRPP
ncbi:hypothetical protein PR003_g14132 [Phytophthora rubi]|uniref:Uncharacterized protein n=1 Tax=Phytophthora rubi TaxID=129364 RepID=A0A6A3L835_9STRA|nr:hypothetical protein PR002_g13850 [Phytophthora rubi]KAE9020980.1 hypothetical protein PR001_g13472 [Phytophthora rubi]KAE9333211.1 hypothetical protein PR003_g14132 [Phytophthora rubi]